MDTKKNVWIEIIIIIAIIISIIIIITIKIIVIIIIIIVIIIIMKGISTRRGDLPVQCWQRSGGESGQPDSPQSSM